MQFSHVGEFASSKSAMKTFAPELRPLITILRSTGPVISTRRSAISSGNGATRQSDSRIDARLREEVRQLARAQPFQPLRAQREQLATPWAELALEVGQEGDDVRGQDVRGLALLRRAHTATRAGAAPGNRERAANAHATARRRASGRWAAEADKRRGGAREELDPKRCAASLVQANRRRQDEHLGSQGQRRSRVEGRRISPWRRRIREQRAAVLPSGERPIRAAEVVGALSLATDLGTGQPLEHAMRTAVLAVRLGELAGASAQELVDTYYVALLHSSGCTSDGHEAAQLYGDDIVPRAAFALVDSGNPAEVLAFLARTSASVATRSSAPTMVEEAIKHGLPAARQTLAMHCEVAQRFAGWLGFSPGTQAALEHVFERWDGLGSRASPAATRSRCRCGSCTSRETSPSSSPPPARRKHARSSSAGRARRTSPGSPSSPHAASTSILAELDETRMWEQALELEPFPQVWIAGERVDTAFAAIAAFTDLKSPWLREHSTGVAELAEAAAWRMALPADVRHPRPPRRARARPRPRRRDELDLGEARAASDSESGSACDSTPTSASAPSPSRRRSLRSGSWPAHTTSGSTAPATTAARAGRRSIRRPAILAAADCYGAMREARPYRPALDAPAAEAELMREAEEERLDPDAVDAVLNAAGHRVEQRPRELPAGLTERELEVLLVLVRGESNQKIAEDLGISAKTVGHHVQHVYQKAGVRSRAAATLWAFEHDLVRTRIGHSPDALRSGRAHARPVNATEEEQ